MARRGKHPKRLINEATRPTKIPKWVQKGENAEARALNALKQVISKTSFKEIVTGVYRTKRNSELDKYGVDIVINTIHRRIVIQVKSSRLAALEFLETHDIICVVAKKSDSNDVTERLMLKALCNAWEASIPGRTKS